MHFFGSKLCGWIEYKISVKYNLGRRCYYKPWLQNF